MAGHGLFQQAPFSWNDERLDPTDSINSILLPQEAKVKIRAHVTYRWPRRADWGKFPLKVECDDVAEIEDKVFESLAQQYPDDTLDDVEIVEIRVGDKVYLSSDQQRKRADGATEATVINGPVTITSNEGDPIVHATGFIVEYSDGGVIPPPM